MKGLDKKAQKLFNQRYLDLFKIVERHKDVISRVTFWGVNDGHSWLNGWPILAEPTIHCLSIVTTR